jgi:thymidylate synthase (FAD)
MWTDYRRDCSSREKSVRAEYMTHSGDDLLVVNAARVSFDKESEWEITSDKEIRDAMAYFVNQRKVLSKADTKLITYLAKHNHWTPFGHPQITLRMSAPVPIRTQCFKHKAGFVENEESRRYIQSSPILYVPDEFREAAESVKQGSAGPHIISRFWKKQYKKHCDAMIDMYDSMILAGVCPEQARFVLPQGCLVNWVWTGSLAAYARFYNLRTDPHAQKEVQMLAEMVGEIIEPLFPVSWKALTNVNTAN